MPSWTPVVIVNADDTPSVVLDEILKTLELILFQLTAQGTTEEDASASNEATGGE